MLPRRSDRNKILPLSTLGMPVGVLVGVGVAVRSLSGTSSRVGVGPLVGVAVQMLTGRGVARAEDDGLGGGDLRLPDGGGGVFGHGRIGDDDGRDPVGRQAAWRWRAGVGVPSPV